MKITFSQLLVIGLMTGISYSRPLKAQDILNKQISLSIKGKSLAEVLQLLTKDNQIQLIYTPDIIRSGDKISVDFKNQTLKVILDKLLDNNGIGYKVLKTKIILFNEETTSNGAASGAAMQELVVTGKVLDEKGQPMIGVTVTEKNTRRGTMTDADGNFRLSVSSSGAVLVFKYISYAVLESPVAAGKVLNIKMAPDDKSLNEVVVIGYGTQKRKDLTGTVGSLDNSEIVKSKAPNAQEALQGRLAGVDVKRSSGKPGSDMTIEIRGANSIGGNTQPLYILDGIPVTSINDVNPSDIERMDVLKDASSTAIYGSRGSNGVVIVTTKKGSSGSMKISYDGYVGIANAYNLPHIMNGPEFVTYAREYNRTRALNLGQDPALVASDDKIFSATELKNIASGNYTDWISSIKQNGIQTNHNLNISGGDGKGGSSYLSLGYQDYQGTTKVEDNKKYTVKVGTDKVFNNRFKVGASVYTTFVDYNPGSLEAFRDAYRLRPTGSAYNADGTDRFFAYETEAQITNPYFDYTNEIRKVNYIRVLPNIYGEVAITKDLKFRTSFSPDITYQRSGYYRDTFTKARAGTQPSDGQYSTFHAFNYDLQNFLTYNKVIGDHKIDVIAGTTLNSVQNDFNTTTVIGLPYRSLWYNLGTATAVTINGTTIQPSTVTGSGYIKQTLASALARINYSYKGRYLVTLTGRMDGNSVLAQGHKSDFFPSAGFAWLASEEDFLKKYEFINLLKLRASYGKSGNAAVPNYNPLATSANSLGLNPYATQVTVGTTYYDFNGSSANGFAPSGLGNNNLTWEKTSEYNFGLELNMFRNRVAFTADYYNKTSKGSILIQQIPAPNGFNTVIANVGSVRNSGVELSLTTVNVKSESFNWTTNFTFSHNQNKILTLYGDGKDDITNKWFLGQPVRVFYDYKVLGVWQTAEAAQAAVYGQKPGQYKIQDLNNDGKINASDRQVLGTNMPQWIGGLTSNFSYKNWDFAVTMYTRQGVMEYNQFLSKFVDDDQGRARFNVLQRDYWTPTNPTNAYANNAIETDADRKRSSEYKDASYTKISNLTLGYTLPKSVLAKLKMNSLRIYTTAYNPFVFTKFVGWDPETAALDAGGTLTSAGFRTRTFLFGVSLTL